MNGLQIYRTKTLVMFAVLYFIWSSMKCTCVTFEGSQRAKRSNTTFQNVLETSRTGNVHRPDIPTTVFKCRTYRQ